jgi:membrane protease YdiL (CAAX protease family)
MLKPLAMCFATAGAIGVGTFIVEYWLNAYYYHSQAPVTAESFLLVAFVSLIEYLPVVFLLEEVWFRGAFDSHVYHIGERRSNLTALYVSLIWGVWHFPITFVPSDGLVGGLELLGQLLALQGAVGFFLSIYWRKSGNLIVSGSAHAFIDAVRNGLNV